MNSMNQNQTQNKGIEICRIFNSCTTCHKKMSEILVKITDKQAMKEQESKERLCHNCLKESKFNDNVLDYELKKYGMI